MIQSTWIEVGLCVRQLEAQGRLTRVGRDVWPGLDGHCCGSEREMLEEQAVAPGGTQGRVQASEASPRSACSVLALSPVSG